uniref:F-box only protein 42 n=1 Tax=Cacopsylla melanoneura TaxID=428564 RepID=A0A8D9BCT3_9HEMI
MEEEANSVATYQVSLMDLPDEVIQYILQLLPPYNDLKTCMQVCKRLLTNVQSVLNYTKLSLNRAISDFNIEWKHMSAKDDSSSITRRYSHSACYHDNFMYIFGGCTFSSTTFNDLWRLDLSTRKWHRLLTSGSYPSPKACASIVPYKLCLVLFGGLTQPSPYPLHQTWRVFNELHIYNINKNNWASISTPTCPPPLAGHSATIHDNVMVVFGGVRENNVSSNDVWCLDLDNLVWTKQITSEVKPTARYGSSQIYIDRHHLLVLGGCGGVHKVYTDAWLLNMTQPDLFTWTPVTIRNRDYAAPHIFCHPAVRVNSRYVITISQNPKLKYLSGCLMKKIALNPQPSVPSQSDNQEEVRVPPTRMRNNMIDDRDVNINGRRGELNALRQQKCPGQLQENQPDQSEREEIESSSSSNSSSSSRPIEQQSERMVAFRCPGASPSPQTMRQRERQLEIIQRLERKIFKMRKPSPSAQCPMAAASASTPPPNKESKMALFVLDISQVLNPVESYIEWKVIRNVAPNSPEPTILYSLVRGRGEVIMFGGMYKNTNSILSTSSEDNEINYNTVSNLVHFISVPTVII